MLPHLGTATLDHVKAALFDDFGTPYSVCRPPRRNDADNLSATVAMIVMEPAFGTMDVAMLPAINRSFSRFSLASGSNAQRQAAECKRSPVTLRAAC